MFSALRASARVAALVLAGAPALGCSDDPGFVVREDEVCFERRDGRRICVETYEATRQDATDADPGTSSAPPRSTAGRLPWAEISWEAARAACRAKDKRLCERDEWIDACDGGVGEAEGTRYPYGDVRDPTICNVSGAGPIPGGQAPGCASGFGVLDMGGNLWEWTGNTPAAATARGGSFRSTRTHDCFSGDATQRFDPGLPNAEVGFRCCRDG